MNECFQARAGCSPRAGQSFCEGFDFGMGWEGSGSWDDEEEVYILWICKDWGGHLFIDYAEVLSQDIFGMSSGRYGC